MHELTRKIDNESGLNLSTDFYTKMNESITSWLTKKAEELQKTQKKVPFVMTLQMFRNILGLELDLTPGEIKCDAGNFSLGGKVEKEKGYCEHLVPANNLSKPHDIANNHYWFFLNHVGVDIEGWKQCPICSAPITFSSKKKTLAEVLCEANVSGKWEWKPLKDEQYKAMAKAALSWMRVIVESLSELKRSDSGHYLISKDELLRKLAQEQGPV